MNNKMKRPYAKYARKKETMKTKLLSTRNCSNVELNSKTRLEQRFIISMTWHSYEYMYNIVLINKTENIHQKIFLNKIVHLKN